MGQLGGDGMTTISLGLTLCACVTFVAITVLGMLQPITTG